MLWLRTAVVGFGVCVAMWCGGAAADGCAAWPDLRDGWPSKGIVIAVTAGLYGGSMFQGVVGNTVLNGHVLPAVR